MATDSSISSTDSPGVCTIVSQDAWEVERRGNNCWLQSYWALPVECRCCALQKSNNEKAALERASSTAATSSQLCQDAERQKPKLIIEPGPYTNGYTVAFWYDESNNIVITHIVYQPDCANSITTVTDDGTMAGIDSDMSQSLHTYLDAVLTSGVTMTLLSKRSSCESILLDLVH